MHGEGIAFGHLLLLDRLVYYATIEGRDDGIFHYLMSPFNVPFTVTSPKAKDPIPSFAPPFQRVTSSFASTGGMSFVLVPIVICSLFLTSSGR